MSHAAITLVFLLFAIIMFIWEKLPLGVTSMIVCIGLIITGVLDWKTAFSGFIDSNVILFVAMFIVGGAYRNCGKIRIFKVKTSYAACICGGYGRKSFAYRCTGKSDCPIGNAGNRKIVRIF